jgi:hypothetical protein
MPTRGAGRLARRARWWQAVSETKALAVVADGADQPARSSAGPPIRCRGEDVHTVVATVDGR